MSQLEITAWSVDDHKDRGTLCANRDNGRITYYPNDSKQSPVSVKLNRGSRVFIARKKAFPSSRVELIVSDDLRVEMPVFGARKVIREMCLEQYEVPQPIFGYHKSEFYSPSSEYLESLGQEN